MFGNGVSLFKLFGFEVRVDASWIILAVLITWSLAVGFFPYYYRDLNHTTYWGMGVAGALGLFASIIFHELSHSIVSRRFGLTMRGITLFIFGGVAEIEGEPPSAKAEFCMAISGPLSSVFLGLLFYGARAWGTAHSWGLPVIGVLGYLKWMNWALAGFNLVPAFPLDGGRVFRSVLWQWKGNLAWATQLSSRIGTGFGFFLMILGSAFFVVGNFLEGVWFFLIGMFLRNAATTSYQKLLMRRAFAGKTVGRFMAARPVTVPPSISIRQLVDDYIYKYRYHMFPVVEGDDLIGCISLQDVKEVPQKEWGRRPVSAALKKCSDINTLAARMDATKAVSMMQQTRRDRMVVVDGGRLEGVITLKDLMKTFSLKKDLEGNGS